MVSRRTDLQVILSESDMANTVDYDYFPVAVRHSCRKIANATAMGTAMIYVFVAGNGSQGNC